MYPAWYKKFTVWRRWQSDIVYTFRTFLQLQTLCQYSAIGILLSEVELYVIQRCRLVHGKLVGGTSAIDCMMYSRGSRDDYDRWLTDYGCDGWSYMDVLPYFIKSEHNMNSQFVGSGEELRLCFNLHLVCVCGLV